MSKQICIDKIIDIFTGFSTIKANNIGYIEEVLFILELMIDDISFDQSERLLDVIIELFDFDPEEEKMPI